MTSWVDYAREAIDVLDIFLDSGDSAGVSRLLERAAAGDGPTDGEWIREADEAHARAAIDEDVQSPEHVLVIAGRALARIASGSSSAAYWLRARDRAEARELVQQVRDSAEHLGIRSPMAALEIRWRAEEEGED